MIDRDFKIYLIEWNTNPCLELPCPLLARVISSMLDNSFRIAIDPLFPPNDFSFWWKRTAALPTETKYQLIFDEEIDGPELEESLKKRKDDVISKYLIIIFSRNRRRRMRVWRWSNYRGRTLIWNRLWKWANLWKR